MAPMSGRLLLAVTWVLSLLPLSAQRALGGALGGAVWLLGTRSAQVTRRNIDLCFPELEERARRRLAAESLRETGRLLCEMGILFHWPARHWQALVVSEEGAELIDAARVQGRSVLLLVPHFGNWEFLALYLGRYGVAALYDPPRFRGLDDVIRRARMRLGARLLPIDAGGLRRFYRHLQDGGVAALLPDQVPAREAGVEAPFFGRSALTMTFAHRAARASGALVLIGSAKRVPGGFHIRFATPDAGIYQADPRAAAAVMNRAVETLIREAPAQYQWEYKRFKRAGQESPYRRR
jgi:Kdo2-lipid IVA lauroyltransferase/acyltransferase